MTVDTDAFDTAMDKQRADARASKFTSGDVAPDAVWYQVHDEAGPTIFLGYDGTEADGTLAAIVTGGAQAGTLGEGDAAELVFDTTPFYGESGGQCGDTGIIRFANGAVFRVEDTRKRAGDLHSHAGILEQGRIATGETAKLSVDASRRTATRANHSATHLLHAALRSVLGAHVTQKGSYVGPDRLRFDFSHNQPVTAEQITAVEAQVNAVVQQNAAVSTREMSPDAAIEAGALALFGEKYGDRVRVLTMGRALADPDKAYSVELCGGTHVGRTGDIALFKIVSESAVSSGVRRIEAVTGEGARRYVDEQIGYGRAAADALKVPPADLAARVASLMDERKKLERQLAEAKKQLAMGGGSGGQPAGPEDIAGTKFIGRVVDGVGGKDLRGLIDDAKASMGSGVAAFIGVNDGKAALAVGVTEDLKDRFSAVDLVKAGSAAVGGKGGGGRPDFAQAGGPDGAKAAQSLDAIRAVLAG